MIRIGRYIGCLVIVAGLILSLGTTISKAALSSDEKVSIVNSVDNHKINAALSISSGGDADIQVKAKGKTDTSRVVLTVTLQHYNTDANAWMEVYHWMASENYYSASLRKNYHVTKTGSYRLKIKAAMTRSGRTETVTETSNIAKY